MKSILFFFVTLLLVGSACSSDDEKTPASSVGSQEAIAKFKTYFYKDGKVNATQLDGFEATEWAVSTDNNARALEVFTDITGQEAPLTSSFDYTYAASDNQCRIRIAGTAQPGSDAVYATFYIQIPACPECDKIHVATPDYFKDINGGDTSQPGVPVIL